jgi:hypothetical protein
MVSTEESDLARIRQVTAKLRAVRHILMTPTPEKLGQCGPEFEEAAELLGSIKGRPDLRAELHVVQRELAVVSALMQQAARYYFGWAQILGAATGGYTPQGGVAPLTSTPRFMVEG